MANKVKLINGSWKVTRRTELSKINACTYWPYYTLQTARNVASIKIR